MIDMPEIDLGTRRRDWEIRLLEYIGGITGAPFEWNKTNCVALAFGCIDAMYDSGLFDWQAGIRLTDARAAVLSREHCTREVLMSVGCVPVVPPYIQRGDIVLGYENEMEFTHFCLGRECVSSSKALGVHLVTTESVLLNTPEMEVLRCR